MSISTENLKKFADLIDGTFLENLINDAVEIADNKQFINTSAKTVKEDDVILGELTPLEKSLQTLCEKIDAEAQKKAPKINEELAAEEKRLISLYGNQEKIPEEERMKLSNLFEKAMDEFRTPLSKGELSNNLVWHLIKTRIDNLPEAICLTQDCRIIKDKGKSILLSILKSVAD